MNAYVLAWLVLPGRFVHDRMTTKDVFLLNAIKTRNPTNWVAVLKDHMVDARVNYAQKLPYGVFISKVLVLQGVDVSKEDRLLCNKSQEIGKASLFGIGLKKTVNGWFVRDEQTLVTGFGNPPTPDEDHTAFIPKTDFEKYVVDQFRKTSKRIVRVEKTLFRLEKEVDVLNKNDIKSGSETEDLDDSNDEPIDEYSMESS
ncbi:hypothetical protein LR48_Vigan10g062700 [Vigna angularis]|uniref:Uncharacterized protein n=1 Tax=Phaseolus angularis TaxID=3914 RepID=A0A0L9VI41_PHAAN|nr:uncharacterized protein HKW66_Vig0180320 [Vigna angularis]KOM54735.1 hypothetical protein LR48_Vigan10g062700 [Vigna angularis]